MEMMSSPSGGTDTEGQRDLVIAALLGIAAGIVNGVTEEFSIWVFAGILVAGGFVFLLASTKLARLYK